jgi:hypothetical protein
LADVLAEQVTGRASRGRLARARAVEVGQPGDFSRLPNKQSILEKLEAKAGPQARELFERFVRDVQKLEAEQGQRATHAGGDDIVAARFRI